VENPVRAGLKKKKPAPQARALALVPAVPAGREDRSVPSRAAETRKMRHFAGMMAVLLPAFATLLPWVLGRPLRIWPLVVSAIFLTVGAIAPRTLIRPFAWWMKLGHVLGYVNSRIILGILFFLVMTPIGLVRRRFGDPMNRAWDPQADTYRQPRSAPDLIQRMETPY